MDSVTITEQTEGGGGGNEIWNMFEVNGTNGFMKIDGTASVSSGTFDFTLDIGGSNVLTMTNIPYDVTAYEFQLLLDANLESIAGESFARTIIVGTGTAGNQLSEGDDFFLTVLTILGSGTLTHSVDSASLTGGTYSSVLTRSPSVGSITPTTGDWTMVINGESTEYMAYNAPVATVQENVEALSAVGTGNVLVETITESSDISSGFRLTFIGDLGNQATGLSIGPIVIGPDSMSTNRYLTGAAGTSEVQRISIAGSPGSGKFSIKLGTGYSQTIDYNQSASELEDILEAVSTIGVGNVTCSGGPFPDTAIDVTFTGGLGGTNVALMVENQGAVETTQEGGAAATVVVDTIQIPIISSETTVNSGPNCWDVAGNWSTNSVPVTGDTVYISESNVSILYGLDQSAVTLAALNVDQTFTGTIGLPRTNADGTTSYSEYRDQYLKIGATLLNIGDKSGVGSERIKINLGTVQTTALITNSGDSPDGNTPVILLLGTHASNMININRGSLGVAYYPTEVSTVATLRQAFFDNAADDTEVYLGTGVTVTDIVKSGGVLDINSNTTSFKQTAGTTTVHAGAHTVLNILAGLLNYNSTGTLSAVNLSGDAVLVFDQDARPKDVTVIDKFTDESEIYDESGSIASPVIDLNKCGDLSTIHMGQDFKLTFGATS